MFHGVQQRTGLIEGLSCAFHNRRNQDVHCAILIVHKQRVSRQLLSRYGIYRDLLSVFIEKRIVGIQNISRIVIDFTQPDAPLHLHRIVGDKIIVGGEVVAGDGHLDAQFRLDCICIIVLSDVGSEVLKQLRFIAAGGFCKSSDDCINLRSRKRRDIHALGLQILADHCDDVLRGQSRSECTALNFLIGENKSSDTLRGQPGHVHAF